jgi:replicative DNA helicase
MVRDSLQVETMSADFETAALKLPPHSVEAEQSVLGGMMLDSTAWEQVAELLSAEDFYLRDHRTIFEVMQRLIDSDQPIDVVTLSETLDRQGRLTEVGGLPYLVELARNTPTASNILAYATIVHERATRRRLIAVAGEIAASSFDPAGRSSAELIDEAESKVFQIADSRSSGAGPTGVNALLSRALERIDELYNAKSPITGQSTGFHDLDEKTSGLQKSDLIIVAGRPSMGKTSFAMNLAENALLLSNKPVLVFSLEMPAESLIFRMLSSLGRIDQKRLRTGKLEDEDWPKLTAAVSKLKDKPLLIDDSPASAPWRCAPVHGEWCVNTVSWGWSSSTTCSSCRSRASVDNRVGEISEISRSLKTMAREFECPVIALSQLNRSLEQRTEQTARHVGSARVWRDRAGRRHHRLRVSR